jgi:hypothetical protein
MEVSLLDEEGKRVDLNRVGEIAVDPVASDFYLKVFPAHVVKAPVGSMRPRSPVR